MAGAEPSSYDCLAAYQQLLQAHDLDPAQVLNAPQVPEPGDHPALLSLAQILVQPELVEQRIRQYFPDAEHPRTRKARVTVLHQSLALQIIGPQVIRLFRDGVSTPLTPEHLFLYPPQSPQETAHWHHAVDTPPPVSPATFLEKTADQMQAWYPVFRQSLGISPGAYWSSVGLALGAPFSLIWNQVDPDALCALATGWLAQFRCDANRYIDWIPADFSQQRCAIPQRRGCCLKYILAEGGYCGTCGIYRKERMGG